MQGFNLERLDKFCTYEEMNDLKFLDQKEEFWVMMNFDDEAKVEKMNCMVSL